MGITLIIPSLLTGSATHIYAMQDGRQLFCCVVHGRIKSGHERMRIPSSGHHKSGWIDGLMMGQSGHTILALANR